jgi:hypothetical protein
LEYFLPFSTNPPETLQDPGYPHRRSAMKGELQDLSASGKRKGIIQGYF